MAWVRFTSDADWPRGQAWHVAYKSGMRCNVPAAAARALIDEGCAVAIRTPPRAQAERLKSDPHWTADAAP